MTEQLIKFSSISLMVVGIIVIVILMNRNQSSNNHKNKNKDFSNIKKSQKIEKEEKGQSNIFFDWLKIVFGRFIMYGGFLIFLGSLISIGSGNTTGGQIGLVIGILIFGMGSFLKHYFRNSK
jgi:hypothetical protein